MNNDERHTDAQSTPAAARCPRCAYDLRGHVETWTDRCPMRGACPECGYGFDWADVLSPTRQRLTWLYEHARRWWDVPRAWGTLLRALVFWRYWKNVGPHHDVRVIRLAMWPAMAFGTLVVLYFATATLITAIIIQAWTRNTTWMPTVDAWLNAALVSAENAFVVQWSPNPSGFPMNELPSSVLTVSTFAILAWLVLVCCPSEWRGGRVRAAHLHRISVYSLAPIAFVLMAHYTLCVWQQLPGLHYTLARRPGHPLHGWMPNVQPPPWSLVRLVRQADEAPIVVGLLVWQWLFLWHALRHGLALMRPWRVALVAGGVGTLGAIVAGVGVWFQFVF